MCVKFRLFVATMQAVHVHLSYTLAIQTMTLLEIPIQMDYDVY